MLFLWPLSLLAVSDFEHEYPHRNHKLSIMFRSFTTGPNRHESRKYGCSSVPDPDLEIRGGGGGGGGGLGRSSSLLDKKGAGRSPKNFFSALLAISIETPLNDSYTPGGVAWVNFCWVCAAGFSEPLTHQSLFCHGNVKKAIGLISKTTTLHVHHAFLYISCCPCITRARNDQILIVLGTGKARR